MTFSRHKIERWIERFPATSLGLLRKLGIGFRQQDRNRRVYRHNTRPHLGFETLQPRVVLAATAIADGDWFDSATWENGILPTAEMRAIIGSGVTVQLDGTEHFAKELVIHGNLVVPEETSNPLLDDKSLTTRWVHVNSGGEFIVGTENDRYDQGTFTLTLTGTDVDASHQVPLANGSSRNVPHNDGFLMTAMEGRVQFYGEEKLSFTKLAKTAIAGAQSIIVENVIERNYDKGQVVNGEFVKSAADDGELNWQAGDEIVIASSSYDYREEDVRIIDTVTKNDDGTSTLTFAQPLDYRHYGELEVYGDNFEPDTTPASQTYEIDLRAEVALLSRNIKIQGLVSQDPSAGVARDTDLHFGDRWHVVTAEHVSGEEEHISGKTFTEQDINVVERVRSPALSPNEKVSPTQVTIGVGGNLMFMEGSGAIVVDGVQLDGMGQASQKGRYPIHWHLAGSRSEDVLRNSSITNSNNRGVTIHGTSDVQIEGVVLHDVHGHGFFFEDAVETGNELVANIAFGIHKVGGNDKSDANPGGTDPFVVDTHDNVTESGSRFKSSAAFWITNPNNTFVGNISAGSSGTGFWYAIPRVALGKSATMPAYSSVKPIYATFGQFDNNVSHSTPVGLNFDRGEDIEDAHPLSNTDLGGNANNYSPRIGEVESGDPTQNFINGFTNYKATDAGVYHRGTAETLFFDDLRIADSKNTAWAVFRTEYTNSLFVGHSRGNADTNAFVGGPRLYDGAGLYTNTHFAGFADEKALLFQVEGSSFGPTMYHAFRNTSFENDDTYSNISHAVSDFPNRDLETANHDLGQPQQWIKAAMDLDGTLTAAAGGGVGYTIVPNVDFLVEATDWQPADWDAWLTDDIYARVKLENLNDGVRLFPGEVTGEPLVRFTSRAGKSIEVMAGQNQGDASWTQVAAKADGDGVVEGTFEIEFMRNGLPSGGFIADFRNQDGDRPTLVPEIQAKVDAARLVTKFVGAAGYTPEILYWSSQTDPITEVASQVELRSATDEVVFYRDETQNLYLNTPIGDQPRIRFVPGDPLQTAYVSRTISYGSTIEAEHFDVGIDGIAYHDTDTINSLSTFRSDTGVDATPNAVGDITSGEWLEYTAAITPGAYRIGLNVSATQAGGQVELLAANSNSAGYLTPLGVFDVTDTDDNGTAWIDGIDLAPIASPNSVFRLAFSGSGYEVNSLQFTPATQTAYKTHSITADSQQEIKLRDYDQGGQGVAYSDTTATNDASDNFRTGEGVDTNGDIVTDAVLDGEWLEFTISDIQAGIYDITLHKSWGGPDKGANLLIGQSNSSAQLTQLGEFRFATDDSGEEATLEGVNLAPWAGADRVLRLEIFGDYMGLNFLRFDPQPQPTPGDYNRDSVVDQADYSMWHSTFGDGVAPLSGADGNGDGTVNLADYTLWRDHLAPQGSMLSAPSASSVQRETAGIAKASSTSTTDAALAMMNYTVGTRSLTKTVAPQPEPAAADSPAAALYDDALLLLAFERARDSSSPFQPSEAPQQSDEPEQLTVPLALRGLL